MADLGKKPEKTSAGRFAAAAACILTGAVCGMLIGRNAATADSRPVLPVILLLALAVWLSFLLHEAGHLVFGLLSGYHFLSFRIGSLVIQRQADGKFVLRRMQLAGTGGQCLMMPPQPDTEGEYPYRLYNLGGVIMNILTGLLSFGVYLAVRKVFFLELAAFSALAAFTNGVPVKNSLLPNDGYNARQLAKDPDARRALWQQLTINACSTYGTRLRDMPDDWFRFPEEKMDNVLVSSVAVFAENRAVDAQDFADARQRISRLLQEDCRLVGIYQVFLKMDSLFLDLLEDASSADLSVLEQKDVKSVMRQMRSTPAVCRMRYAAALLAEKDTGKAEKIRRKFESGAARYPVAAETASERELMALCDARRPETDPVS